MSGRYWILDMSFPERVVRLRKHKDWTQQELADKVGVKVLQIRRYENGSSQPTLEVIKNLAIALGVTTDELIFDTDERDPSEDLRLQFETLSQFDDEDKLIVQGVLEGLILKHQAKQSIARQMAAKNKQQVTSTSQGGESQHNNR